MSREEDLRCARTLPSEVYTSPDLHARLIERGFARAWHYLGPAELAPQPGDVVPLSLAPGSLDEPVLLSRDEDGRVRALSNVCTHRGLVMVGRPCRVRNIRCGYHGRRFGLDGRLKAAPGFEDAEDFPSPTDDLPELSLGRWGPLWFASLDPEVPFERWIEPVRARLEFFDPDRMLGPPAEVREYPVAAPWIAYCDNYLEGMHIPYVHPGLAQALAPEAYETHLFEQSSLQIGIADAPGATFDLPPGHPDAGKAVAGYYFALFPNTLINLYPWGLSLNVVEPLGHDRTRVRFISFVADAARRAEGAGAGLDAVEREDEAVVERVAVGLRARLYHRGRYSPRHEACVHHFHRQIARCLELD